MFVKHDAASQSSQRRTGSASSARVTRALNRDTRQEVTIELILSPEAVAQVKNVGDVLRNRSLNNSAAFSIKNASNVTSSCQHVDAEHRFDVSVKSPTGNCGEQRRSQDRRRGQRLKREMMKDEAA